MIVSQALVRSHLSYHVASVLIEEGLLGLRSGAVQSPNRKVYTLSGEYPVLGVMPSSDEKFIGAKVATVNYQNGDHGLDSHQGAMLLFERPSGALKAIIDATELTAIRTTAVSHLVTRLLLSIGRSFNKIAIIGAGVQAYHHIKMFCELYKLENFVVMSKSPNRVKELSSALKKKVNIEHRTYGSLLQDCQLVVVATHADEVVLQIDQIPSNTVILAIGACRPGAQEIHPHILDRSIFIGDDLSACAESSGEGWYAATHSEIRSLELSDLITSGDAVSQFGILVFKSIGLGFEDLVCARYLYEGLSQYSGVVKIDSFGGMRAY